MHEAVATRVNWPQVAPEVVVGSSSRSGAAGSSGGGGATEVVLVGVDVVRARWTACSCHDPTTDAVSFARQGQVCLPWIELGPACVLSDCVSLLSLRNGVRGSRCPVAPPRPATTPRAPVAGA
jgi:hypothetical protein